MIRRFYGASALHLVGVSASLGLAFYAGRRLLATDPAGVGIWWLAGILLHDLALVGVYTAVDRPFRRFAWRNYLRVPAALSALLFLMWSPLILRLSDRFESASGRPIDPFLGNWIKVTLALFGASAVIWLGGQWRASWLGSAVARTSDPPG